MANKSNNPGRLFTGDSSTYRGKPKPLVPFGSLDRVNRSNLVDPMSEDDSARFDIAKEAERRGVPVQRILDERAMAAARGPKRQSPEPNRLMVTDEDGTRIATPDEVGIQDFSGDIKEETARKDMDEAERLRGSIARVEDQLRNAKTIEKKQKLTRALKNLNAKFSTVTQTEAERDASSVAAADRKYLRREEVRRELARRSIERRINRGVDPRIIDRHNEGAAGRGVDRFIAPEEVGLSRRVPEDGEIIEGKTGPSRVQSDGQGSPVEVPVQETADGSYVIDGSAMPPEQFQEHYKASDGRAFRSEIYRNGGAFADRQRRIDSGRMALLDDDLDEDAKAEGQAALDEREAALHYEFSKRVGSKRPVVDSSKKGGNADAEPEPITDKDIIDFINEQRKEDGERPITSFAEVSPSVVDAAAAAIARAKRQAVTVFDRSAISNAPPPGTVVDTTRATFDDDFIKDFNSITDQRFVSVDEVREYIKNNPDERRAAVTVANQIGGNDLALRTSILERFLP